MSNIRDIKVYTFYRAVKHTTRFDSGTEYDSWYEWEPSESLPGVGFRCDRCRNEIELVHPEEIKQAFDLGYWEKDIHLCAECLIEREGFDE